MLRRSLLFLGAALFVFYMVAPGNVFAHPMTIDEDFADMTAITVTHEDEDPFKGMFQLTATNYGSIPWGDFHFKILPCMGSDVSTVDIVTAYDAGPPEMFAPTMSQTGTYTVDNAPAVEGSELDYYFYSDPVGYGEYATFTFYTDNTTAMVNFCITMCPTPVPEPSMLSMLALGLATMMLARRRK